MRARTLAGGVAVAVALACLPAVFNAPGDAMLNGDWLDAATQLPAEIVPGTSWWQPGANAAFGDGDDVIATNLTGDIDIVVRTGTNITNTVPRQHTLATAPVTFVAPLGAAGGVPFSVASTAAAVPPFMGAATAAPSLEGVPIVSFAFADLDGDGAIGITLTDGNAGDFELEEAELLPVGRVLVVASQGRASGVLRVEAGGPSAAPLSLAVAAATWAGSFDPNYFNGIVPRGPMVMTHFPFRPLTHPSDALDFGPAGLAPPDPDEFLGVRTDAGAEPNPADARFGESYTLFFDGSRNSVDLAVARSGTFARVGLATIPRPLEYVTIPSRPLRPGLDDAGNRALYEIVGLLRLRDDGVASRETLRLVPLDALGNIADLPAAQTVTVRSSGPVRIVAPDNDGNFTSETVTLANARGLDLVVDDAGGAWDGPNRGALWVDAPSGLFQASAVLPDPDVDDSGVVTSTDVARVASLRGVSEGEPGFDSNLDLTCDGRIDRDDEDLARAALGQNVSTP